MCRPASVRIVSGVCACATSLSGVLSVEIFVAIPFAARNPPSGARIGDRELGELVADVHFAQLRLVGKFVAEADAVVERAKDDDERTRQRCLLDQPHAHLVVAVAHVATLAPRLLPGLIDAARLDAVASEVALELRRVGQQEAEARLVDDQPAAARHRIAGTAFVVDRDGDAEHVAGRADGADRLGARDAHPECQKKSQAKA